jgi:hypothetical protein
VYHPYNPHLSELTVPDNKRSQGSADGKVIPPIDIAVELSGSESFPKTSTCLGSNPHLPLIVQNCFVQKPEASQLESFVLHPEHDQHHASIARSPELPEWDPDGQIRYVIPIEVPSC